MHIFRSALRRPLGHRFGPLASRAVRPWLHPRKGGTVRNVPTYSPVRWLLAIILAAVISLAATPASSVVPPEGTLNLQPVPTCKTVLAKTFNDALRQRARLRGKKLSRKRLVHEPVCVRPDYRRVQAQIKRLRRAEARKLATNPHYAIPRAFRDVGIPGQVPAAMRVARCESTFNRFARNGQYAGLFQLSASHQAAMTKGPWFHAYANAYRAAVIVRGDGGWGQWECRP